MTSPSEEFVIRRRKLELDDAATLDAEGISFTHLRVSDASDTRANVQLVFANLDNPGITLKRGIRLENFAIQSGKVWFTNTAQAGKFVEVEYWGGPPVGPPRIVDEGLLIDTEDFTSIGNITRSREDQKSFAGGAVSNGINFQRVQLRNPSQSGVDSVVQSIITSVNALSDATMMYNAGAQGNAVSNLKNKFVIGSDPKLEIRELSSATTPGTIGPRRFQVPANTDIQWVHGDPFILPQGADLYIFANTAGVDINAYFEWFENPK